MRAVELAALKGKAAGVRSAADAHRRAVTEAVQRATELASVAGLQPPAGTLARTFEALSLAEVHPPAPGRLTDVLQPGGFEALAGVAIAHQPTPAPTPAPRKPALRIVAPREMPAAERARERQRAVAERAERRSADAAVKKASRLLEDARTTESRARASADRAAAAVRAAERALADARTRLDRLVKPE